MALTETSRATIALLREDPDLAVGISAEELPHAERLVVVPGFTLDAGPWEVDAAVEEPSLGLLILEGLVTNNIVLRDRVASHLAGPGDVIHVGRDADALLPTRHNHFVSERARIAVLDRTFIAAVRRWPALMLALHERIRAQEHRLAVHAAIGKLRRVDDRVLALLWHLGERWGKMTGDGIVVPLALTHETIGRLAGAERPTVSLALSELAERGDVMRRDDGAYVVAHASRDRLRADRTDAPQLRPLPVRRTEEVARPETAPAAGVTRTAVDIDALRSRITALHDQRLEEIEHHEELQERTRRATERSAATRDRVAADRAARRDP